MTASAELFSDGQIAVMRREFGTLAAIQPESLRGLRLELDSYPVATLRQLARAKINFISALALLAIRRRRRVAA